MVHITEPQRERFQFLVEAVPNAMIMADRDGRITLVNHNAEGLFGYSSAELVGQPLEFLIPARFRDRHPSFVANYFAAPKARSMGTGRELFGLRKDGSEVPIEIGLNPVESAGEWFTLASIIDITERKRSAEVQQEMTALVESADDAILTKSLDGIIRSWNPGAERLLGYRASEVIGQSITRLLPDDRKEEESLIIGRIRRGERVTHFETIRRRKDGSQVDVSLTISPIHDHAGTIVGASKIMRDITERKRTEAALHESERQFGTMVNTIPQLAWMANADGHIFWYNQRWFDYTGTSLVHMEEWGWRSVHDPEFLPVVLERWQTSIATGEVFEMEFPLRAADGHFGWFLTRVFPFKDAEGQVVRWFGTNTDLSEQRKAADEISRLNANLEQRVAERTSELEAFSYTVSHDLRAPLRHLQGYVELLTRETAACPLPDPAQRHLRTIAEVSGEMGQLIDDLLAFSRVGKVDLRRTRVLPNELVQEVIGGLDMAVRERPIDWQIATLPPVLGDPSALKQLFANLIGNAVKYTRPRDPARIEIGCSGETNGRLTLFVRDNGVGFDTQYSHKLFGVFQRLHRAQDFEGTGIGLAIVQRIVKRHDGRVWAESALNQGATFYFTLQPATANYREDTA